MELFKPFVELRPFSTADAFLAFIRRSNEEWWHGDYCPWIFRGQWNADWALQPAAFRPLRFNALRPLRQKVFESMGERQSLQEIETGGILLKLQYLTETEALTQFADLARDVGFSVSRGQGSFLKGDANGLTFDRRPKLPREDNYNDHYCPEVSLMPIAQHHGVPTRLIDFSTDPILATYFAVGEEFRPKPAGDAKFIALHAINTRCWLLDDFLRQLVVVDGLDGVTETDDFIRSQGGQFIFIKRAADYFLERGIWPSIEDVMASESLKIQRDPRELDRFHLRASRQSPSLLWRKLTLPVSEVPAVLKKLDREGTSLAHLMPTLDNVARTIVRRWGRGR